MGMKTPSYHPFVLRFFPASKIKFHKFFWVVISGFSISGDCQVLVFPVIVFDYIMYKLLQQESGLIMKDKKIFFNSF